MTFAGLMPDAGGASSGAARVSTRRRGAPAAAGRSSGCSRPCCGNFTGRCMVRTVGAQGVLAEREHLRQRVRDREQPGRGLVDALVGGLRRQDHRHQQLERARGTAVRWSDAGLQQPGRRAGANSRRCGGVIGGGRRGRRLSRSANRPPRPITPPFRRRRRAIRHAAGFTRSGAVRRCERRTSSCRRSAAPSPDERTGRQDREQEAAVVVQHLHGQHLTSLAEHDVGAREQRALTDELAQAAIYGQYQREVEAVATPSSVKRAPGVLGGEGFGAPRSTQSSW